MATVGTISLWARDTYRWFGSCSNTKRQFMATPNDMLPVAQELTLAMPIGDADSVDMMRKGVGWLRGLLPVTNKRRAVSTSTGTALKLRVQRTGRLKRGAADKEILSRENRCREKA